METNERSQYILQELLATGQVNVDELSQRLEVNTSTIRRDLERMERRHLLRRVHGGAVPADTFSYGGYANDLTFQTNVNKQVEEKNRIALAAAQGIEPGDSIAISPGTTTTYLARTIRMQQIPNLTIVTNAINIAMELAGLRGLNLIMTGGIFLPDFFALVGPTAEQNLREIFVQKAFIGVTGLHVQNGLTGPNQLEAHTHRLTLERARRSFVLADHTKIGHVALYNFAPITAVHTLITGKEANSGMLEELRAREIEVQAV